MARAISASLQPPSPVSISWVILGTANTAEIGPSFDLLIASYPRLTELGMASFIANHDVLHQVSAAGNAFRACVGSDRVQRTIGIRPFE